MAGIGVKLNQIYEKHTLTTNLIGFGYSAVVTVAPMFLIIGNILLMSNVLNFSKEGYASRELFACTVLYIFVFSLITVAPFSALMSKYLSDVIYEERYDDILPCFYVGLWINVLLSVIISVPFCIREYLVGGVGIFYVFAGFCGYISLVIVFYAMLFLSICKDYQKISIFFLLGMGIAFGISVFLVNVLAWKATEAMLFSLVTGFFLIACLETALIKRYFKRNSGRYLLILPYFKQYWMLILTNFLYTLGLYIHNFVFWTTDLKMTVADTFVCAPQYDLATCIAMITNISTTIIFITRVEMHFHEKYKAYSEAIIGGRGMDIQNAKNRMFQQLAAEIMNLVRIQFIISVIMFLLCVVLLPQIGISGLVMRIYPCLAAGYFILFIMYSAIIFLFYFNDMKGALITTVCFTVGTLVGSILASYLSEIWYGIGVVFGALLGWVVAYKRLRWVEKNMDIFVFCQGHILKRAKGEAESSKVYDAYAKGGTKE